MKVLRIILLISVLALLPYSSLGLRTTLRNSGFFEKFRNGKDGKAMKSITFDKANKLKLDLYLPKNVEQNTSNALVLFIHGGSWQFGNRSWEAHNCKRYAKEGYITATIDYRLLKKKGPSATFFDMLADIEHALGKIKELSDAKGWNIDRMAIGGNSAGGHLSLLFAYSGRPSPFPIKMAVVTVAPIDFHLDNWRGFNDSYTDQGMLDLMNSGAGTHFTLEDIDTPEALEVLRSISPVSLAGSSSVPTVMAYGDLDQTQNPENGRILKAILDAAGVDNTLVTFPHSRHMLGEDPEVTLEFFAVTREYLRKYL